jgi:hypothetical protein
MKKKILLILFGILGLTLVSCGSNEEGTYRNNEIDFYKTKDAPSKKVNLRFYEKTPNVPYVGVKQFYKEFYNTDFRMNQSGDTYKFNYYENAFISFDTNNEIMSVLNVSSLGFHPDFLTSNSTIFLKHTKTLTTTPQVKTVDLKNYNIETYRGNDDVYVPLQLISNLSADIHLFCITYNGKNLYEIDYSGQLSNSVGRLDTFYGDSFFEPIVSNEKRKDDVIDFSYNLLCLEIDNFRGYTNQMAFIDNNIVSNGLNGTLEAKYPNLKKLLLSSDKEEYCAGIISLFSGLSDGGHTGFLSKYIEKYPEISRIIEQYSEINKLNYRTSLLQFSKTINSNKIIKTKKTVFDLEDTKYYYHSDDTNHLAYIGFDTFEVNYSGWDQYYNKLAKGEEVSTLIENDSYSFLREALFKALDEGETNVVIDIASNGGGDSNAVVGIYGLLNKAKGSITMNNVVAKSKSEEQFLVDVNLDGKYDEKDVLECTRLENLNIVIMTSSCSFSSGNLLPCLLKEAGYKIIGEKSGGGSCAIQIETTAEGLLYVRSSCNCLSDNAGNNIDSGVEVDYSLTYIDENSEVIKNMDDVPDDVRNSLATSYDNFYNPVKVLEAINAIKDDNE